MCDRANQNDDALRKGEMRVKKIKSDFYFVFIVYNENIQSAPAF